MARKTAVSDDDIIDLTELIENGSRPAKKAAPPVDDDLEDLISRTESADDSRVSGQNASPVDAHEELDMVNMGDIDNLLESLDIPAQPREAPAASSAPAPDELDNVLDDLLGPEPASGGQQSPPQKDSFAADLDAILDDAEPDAATAPAPARDADPDADLDDLLSSIDEVPPRAQPPSAPAAAKKPAPQKAQPPRESKPASPPPAPDMDMDADLDDILAEVEEPIPPKPRPAPQKTETRPAAVENPLDEIDAMLEEEPRRASSVSKEVESPQAPPRTAREPEIAMSLPAQIPPQELIAGICQNVVASRDSVIQDSLNGFSGQIGAQNAHIEDLRRQIGELGKRLVASEAKLTAARSRIAQLEKGMESVAALEDLLKDGTPMHAGFTSLIAAAVGQALQGFASQRSEDPEIAEKMRLLEDGDKRVNARMDMLEKRLDDLEPNFNAQVQKAAASAAARILHEEIGKLVSEM